MFSEPCDDGGDDAFHGVGSPSSVSGGQSHQPEPEPVQVEAGRAHCHVTGALTLTHTSAINS